MSKLVLGTAQFGLDYGINNKIGEIPEAEVFAILDLAISDGIDTLDTAYNYGSSEEKIGRYLKKNSGKTFKVISKLPGDGKRKPAEYLKKSLKRLGLKKIHGYLVHSFESVIARPSIYQFFKDLKQQKLVQKIGVSLYYPSEIDELLAKGMEFDIIQLPYNLFDQRFEGYLPKLKKAGIEVYARSAFLQGLFFKDPETLPDRFSKVKDKLLGLRQLARREGTTVQGLALGFCLTNPLIDKVVVGVDSKDHLEELVRIEREPLIKKIDFDKFKGRFAQKNENIIIPSKW